jgi:hypothetical protein
MPELSFEFEVFCDRCGAGLCMNCTEGRTQGRGMPFIRVEPCEKCLDARGDAEYEKGVDQGRADAEKESEAGE